MSLYIVMMCLFYVPQRKNDQYLEGHTAFLARTGKVTRPVAVTEQLIKLKEVKHDAGMLTDSGLRMDLQRNAFSPTGQPL